MNAWLRNGERVTEVVIDDRAVQYGDGLFETIAIRDEEPRLWSRHLERLAKGCECLGIEMPPPRALAGWLGEALRESNEDRSYCIAKIIVSSGIARRGYGRGRPSTAETLVGIFPAARLPTGHYRDGVDTIVCETRLALHSVTAGLKTLNRIEQVLASSERIARSAFEGLTLDADARLICGTMSNVFMVSANAVSTPSLRRCGVAGVMRGYTIECLKKQGMPVVIRDISGSELRAADEVFLTNSQFGALPVRSCEERVWPSHPTVEKIMAILSRCGIEECSL